MGVQSDLDQSDSSSVFPVNTELKNPDDIIVGGSEQVENFEEFEEVESTLEHVTTGYVPSEQGPLRMVTCQLNMDVPDIRFLQEEYEVSSYEEYVQKVAEELGETDSMEYWKRLNVPNVTISMLWGFKEPGEKASNRISKQLQQINEKGGSESVKALLYAGALWNFCRKQVKFVEGYPEIDEGLASGKLKDFRDYFNFDFNNRATLRNPLLVQALAATTLLIEKSGPRRAEAEKK